MIPINQNGKDNRSGFSLQQDALYKLLTKTQRQLKEETADSNISYGPLLKHIRGSSSGGYYKSQGLSRSWVGQRVITLKYGFAAKFHNYASTNISKNDSYILRRKHQQSSVYTPSNWKQREAKYLEGLIIQRHSDHTVITFIIYKVALSQEAKYLGVDSVTKMAAQFDVAMGGHPVDDQALPRMSQAIQSLDTILQELREVERISQSRTPADNVDAISPNFIHLLARSLTGKLETLTAGIRDDVFVRTLLPTLPAAPNVGTISNNSPDTTLACCIPRTDHHKQAKTSATQMTGCRHFCKHHKEVVDPWLWSTLPLELVEIVFAKLPLQTIITLSRHHEAWAELTDATNFREFCAERHPKLLALVRWDAASMDGDTVRATVFDVAVSRWVSFDIAGFPPSRRCNPATVDYGYEDARVAHDGGLVCFVPPSDLAVAPVLVCNPLTGEIRRLALIPGEHRRCHLVQIVVDAGTKEYRVMIVCGRDRMAYEVTVSVSPAPEDTSHCYDSATKAWSVMKNGYVYGCGRSLKPLHRAEAPAVFDCRTKVLYRLKYRIPESRLSQTDSILGWSSVQNRMVVLHDSTTISEFAWVGSKYITHTTVGIGPYIYREKAPHEVFIFASDNFYVVMGENSTKNVNGKHDQLIQIYDRSARRWHRPAPPAADESLHTGTLHTAFMCELRWNAVP